jgi:hypothetical protein
MILTDEEIAALETEAKRQCHLQLARVIAMTPGVALELYRLARIGVAAEARDKATKEPAHV